MSIKSEILRIQTNISNAYAKLEEKGATMPNDRDSNNLANTIDSLVLSSSNVATDIINGTITTVDQEALGQVESIRANAFDGLNVETVNVPSNVVTIGDSAFANNSITTLTINEGVETIGNGAFQNNSIAQLTIPASITSIGDSAFAGNILTEITMESDVPPVVTETTFPDTLQATNVSYNGYVNYVSDPNWQTYKNTLVRGLAIPSTITVIVNDYTGALVSGASVTISGNGQTYTGTTDSVGTFVQGDLQPATYTISVADMEGFKTPASSEVVVEEDTQNSVTMTYAEKPAFPVYGVSWTNDATTTMTRTDDSVGMTYSINSSTGKVTSDFDHVFPYNQMKRQVIGVDTFVYVPSMWFRVVADSDQKITSVAVSEAKGDGDNWYKTKPFYYGAYGASSNGTVLKSVSGVDRLNKITRATARTRAMAVGTGYHQRDLCTGTILMFLWWIEFATKNSQSVMGGCTSGTKTGGTNSIYNESEGDAFCVSGYETSTMQMVWHGIEDYVGNLLEWEDGITGDGVSGGKQYVSDDYTLYDDYSNGSKMSALSFNAPTTSGNCLEALGWDSTKPFLCQPIATRSGYDSGFCDYASTSNNIVVYRGSRDPSYDDAGVSYFARGGVSESGMYISCRLMKEV